ncbi:MAG TPA: hypothetical protein VGU20_31885 [Stellaceae bacterium]|nr:hypothetical protein [Stellaceae bacterium]
MLTNDSFYVALEERERMALAKPANRAPAKWRDRVTVALSFAALGALILGLLALRLWLSLPSWVHFAD